MSVTYGFFNSVNRDRLYDANQFSSIFNGIILDGVFSSVGDKFMVTPGEGLSLVVGTGRSWFNGHWTYNDAPVVIDIPAPVDIYGMYYALIIDVDEVERTAGIALIHGASALDPVKPNLIRSEIKNQYAIAYIKVGGRGTTEIFPENIEYVVGSEGTPLVTGLIQQATVGDLITNWKLEWENETEGLKDEFDLWFRDLKNELSGDVAGNLYTEINDVKQLLENLEDAERIAY